MIPRGTHLTDKGRAFLDALTDYVLAGGVGACFALILFGGPR